MLETVAGAIAVSPDGRNIYLLGGVDNRTKLTVVNREPRSGKLSRPAGRAACVRPWYVRARICGSAPGLNNSRALAVSADGRDVAIAAYPTPQLTLLRRQGGAGVRFGSCVGESVGGFRCTATRGFLGAVDLAFSPDGRNVYVAARPNDQGLITFVRNPATGALRQLPGASGCLQRQGRINPERPPCAVVPAQWYTPYLVRVTPDGRNVITVSGTKEGNGIFVFRRQPGTGALTPLTCYVDSGNPPCEPNPAPASVRDVAITRDGRTLIATSGEKPVLTVLALDPTTGVLEQRQCLARTAIAGCDRAPALEFATLALTADESRLFVANSDMIRSFRLAADRTLTPIAGRGACLSEQRSADCTPLPKQLCCSIGAIALSPDGRWLYASAGEGTAAFQVRG